MKRYPNLTIFLTLMIIFVSAGGFLALVSFKSNARKLFKVPIIVNKGKEATMCLAPRYMMNAWYHIERIEAFKDTLDLSHKNSKPGYYEFYEDPTEGRAQLFSTEGLSVIVDTVNELSMTKRPIWASYLFHRNFNDTKEVLQDDTLIQEVKSFPIYIVNRSSTKTANLETQDASAMMIVEAMDAENNWKPIEYWSNSWCGNSYMTINIAPLHYAFTRGIKCSGDIKTKCRVKLLSKTETHYSNTFYMNISASQFAKPI